jgi:hypothetical protein
LSQPSSVGLKEVTNSLLSIYPNPVNENLTIKLSTEEKTIEYKIFDIAGKVILKGVLLNNSKSINVSMIDSGTYTIEISSGNKIIGKQLILKN